MIIKKTSIEGLCIIQPKIIEDDRGYFFRSFCNSELKEAGLGDINFVQMNQSYNKFKGTFRGFHFQIPPFSEDKMIRCVKGRVFDYAIDIRSGSKTFLKYEMVELSEYNHQMIFIPKGFAHGFITSEPETVLLYYHTQSYQPGFECGISFQDPLINIQLPEKITIISGRDKSLPYLSEDFKGIEI